MPCPPSSHGPTQFGKRPEVTAARPRVPLCSPTKRIGTAANCHAGPARLTGGNGLAGHPSCQMAALGDGDSAGGGGTTSFRCASLRANRLCRARTPFAANPTCQRPPHIANRPPKYANKNTDICLAFPCRDAQFSSCQVKERITNVTGTIILQQFAASAAVRIETGNFTHMDTQRGTPAMGVPESVPMWGIPVPDAGRE